MTVKRYVDVPYRCSNEGPDIFQEYGYHICYGYLRSCRYACNRWIFYSEQSVLWNVQSVRFLFELFASHFLGLKPPGGLGQCLDNRWKVPISQAEWSVSKSLPKSKCRYHIIIFNCMRYSQQCMKNWLKKAFHYSFFVWAIYSHPVSRLHRVNEWINILEVTPAHGLLKYLSRSIALLILPLPAVYKIIQTAIQLVQIDILTFQCKYDHSSLW